MENELKIILSGDASQLEAATNKANKALNGVKQSSASASYALTNLSRVAQDAPFGFIAIQNNLSPLIESFGQLKTQSGSVGGALKSLGSSLLGPAGIGVGFSVVTALVTTAIQKYGSLTAALDALFSSTDAAAMAQKQLNQVEADAAAQVQGQLSSVNALLSVAQDNTLSNEQRLLAIKKLNQEYPQYLGNLTLENVNTQKTTESVNKLTESLIRKAKIEGVQKLITKLSEDQANAYLQLKQNIEDTNSPLQYFVDRISQSVTGTSASIKSITSLGIEFGKSEKQIAILQEALNNLTKEQAVNGEITTKQEKSTKNVTKAAKEQGEAVRITADYWKNLATATTEVENSFSKGTTGLFGKGGNGVLKQIENIQAAGDKINQTFVNIGNAIADTLAPAFTTLFDSILSGSQNSFQAFGQAIAGVIRKLAVAAATAAVLAVIIAAATGGTNFGAGTGASVANFTSGFKAIFGQLSGLKFADGGIVSGPTRALIGEAGPEAVIPLSKLNSIIGGNSNVFVTGVLSGETIFLQQQRTEARRQRFV